MKNIFVLISTFLLISFFSTYAQWTKVADYNVGANGKIAVNNSTVFLYGYQGKQFVYRSTDSGGTWTNIAGNFPDDVFFLYGTENEIFAIVGVNAIYSSTDDGLTWNKASDINFSGGAVLSLTMDGKSLYALTNRNSVFRSNDNAKSWQQITINYTEGQLQGYDFAAAGSLLVFCATGLGSFISMDAGANWTLKNPSIIIGSVHTFNDEIYGSTYGMYKLQGTDWNGITSGFPSGIGVSGSTKGTVSIGNKIFTYYTDVIKGSKVFGSDDYGSSWYEVGNDLPSASSTSLNNFLAASPHYLYCYIYSIFSPNDKGVYRYEIQTKTSVNENKLDKIEEYSISQNYPNPFNPMTTITYTLPEKAHVEISVFNSLGEEIAKLVNEDHNAGKYKVVWNAQNYSSGIYYYNLKTGNFTSTHKMLLLK